MRFSEFKALKFNSFLTKVMFHALLLTLVVSLIFVKTVWSNGTIVINEVELNPNGNDNSNDVYEWVELYNPSSVSIDISGWKLSTTQGSETHTITIPQGTILTPYSYYVYERGSQWLDNNDETVILRNNDGATIEQTPLLSDGENDALSWQRYPNGVGGWSFRSSTKGYSNGGIPEPTPEPTPTPPSSPTPEPTPTPTPTPSPIPTAEPTPEPTPEPEAPSQDIFEALVVDIIDGDTFDTAEGYRIRLADIDAPEIDETGYLESTEYLELLVENKNVTLNIDSVTGTDPYGRYVCLVYVEYNSTHCLNVNQALVEGGYAVVDNYTNNEFEPNTWRLYSLTETIPELPPKLIMVSAIMMLSAGALVFRKKVTRYNKTNA